MADRDAYDRRRFLQTGLLGGAAMIAGCGGTSTVDDTSTTAAQTDTDDGGGGTGTTDTTGTPSGDQSSKMGGRFVGASAEGAPTLDPRMNELAWYNGFAQYMFSTLYAFAPDGSEIVPHLAAKQPQKVDETTFDVPIRQGAKFHDGEEVTAEDVAYSLNWILNPENKSPNRANLNFINEVSVQGEYTARFSLKYPYALFQNVLTSMNAPVVPKHVAEGKQQSFAEKPVGSGPFKFDTFESASYIQLSRFDDYFLKTPNLASVRWRIIPKRQVQFVELATGGLHQASVPKALLNKAQSEPNINVKVIPGLDYNGLIFNSTREPFNKLKVRKAMQYLVSYDEMLKVTKGKLGDRSYGFLPPEVNKAWDFPWKEWKSKYYPERDHEKAKQLLRDAGALNIDKELHISSLASAEFKSMAVVLQRELKKVGINSRVQEVTIGQWLNQLTTKDYDITIYGWGGGSDPDGFYYYLFRDEREDEDYNAEEWNGDASAGLLYKLNQETGKHEEKLATIDNNIREARKLLSKEERRPLYVEAAENLQSLYPHIPVYSEGNAIGWRKAVQDFDPTAFQAQPLCNEWHNSWLK